jgi:hypothetical protein
VTATCLRGGWQPARRLPLTPVFGGSDSRKLEGWAHSSGAAASAAFGKGSSGKWSFQPITGASDYVRGCRLSQGSRWHGRAPQPQAANRRVRANWARQLPPGTGGAARVLARCLNRPFIPANTGEEGAHRRAVRRASMGHSSGGVCTLVRASKRKRTAKTPQSHRNGDRGDTRRMCSPRCPRPPGCAEA